MIRELGIQSGYLEDQAIETIYFGGGTPSAIPEEEINMIIGTIRNSFVVRPDAEITLEANPDDISMESLEAWKKMGIKRLSIGLQSFQDDLLKSWNRSHTSIQAKKAITLAHEAGFENITADLIYGGSGLTDKDWIENIRYLVDTGIPHVSCYALTVESGTALAYQIKKGKVIAPDDEVSNRQYSILQSILRLSGYEQYEVSNFAKPGWKSKHNTNYWSGVHYLGIGPSAHSFNGISRQWNISNNGQYIQSIENGIVPFEKEMLTEIQLYNELVMTGLRTSPGIDAGRVEKLGDRFSSYLDDQVHSLIEKNQREIAGDTPIIKNETGNWMLKPEYYFFADGIAADLFYEEK